MFDPNALLVTQWQQGYRFIQDGKRFIAETPFSHLDGDPLEIFLEPRDSTILITDLGTTIGRLKRQRVSLSAPWREQAIRTVKATFGMDGRDGVLEADVEPSKLIEGLSGFIAGVLMISALAFRERREQVASEFPEEVFHFVEEHTQHLQPRIVRNWFQEKIDPQGTYTVDVAVLHNGDRRFVFAITSEHRCLTAAVTCYFLRFRQQLPFRSLAVFEAFSEIAPKESERIIGAADVVAPSLLGDRDKIEEFLLSSPPPPSVADRPPPGSNPPRRLVSLDPD